MSVLFAWDHLDVALGVDLPCVFCCDCYRSLLLLLPAGSRLGRCVLGSLSVDLTMRHSYLESSGCPKKKIQDKGQHTSTGSRRDCSARDRASGFYENVMTTGGYCCHGPDIGLRKHLSDVLQKSRCHRDHARCCWFAVAVRR